MDWILALRHDALTPLFLALTFLGDATFFLLFLPIGYWLDRRRIFFRLILVLVFAGLFNTTLKGLFQVPRPDVERLVEAGGWSFPSGHAQMAATLWPWLALELRRRWAWILAAVLVPGIALSRVYLGVHTPRDVAAGVAVGLATVAVAHWALPRLEAGWTRLGPWTRSALIVAVVALWLALMPGDVEGVSATAGGFVVGFWLGDLHRRHRSPDAVPESAGRRLAAVALGLAGVFGLRVALKAAFAGLGTDVLVADALRYATIGLWMSDLAPRIFIRLGLTAPPPPSPAE